MKKILILSAMAALVMSSCTKSDDEITPTSNEMKFAAEYPTTRATATAFESGDAMGVYVSQYDGEVAAPLQVSGNYANNVKSTFDGLIGLTASLMYLHTIHTITPHRLMSTNFRWRSTNRHPKQPML